jgi:hypothetical protein
MKASQAFSFILRLKEYWHHHKDGYWHGHKGHWEYHHHKHTFIQVGPVTIEQH